MQGRSVIIRAGITLALLMVFVVHVAGIGNIRLVSQLENFAYDARVRLTMPGAGDSQVVILDIDERSISAEGQWPWPRDRLAATLDQLFDRYHARAVGFDMAFPEADRNVGAELLRELAEGELATDEAYRQAYARLLPELQTDERFARSFQDRKVVLGYVFRPFAFEDADNALGALPSPLFRADDVSPALVFLKPEGYTANVPVLQQYAASGGFFDNPVVDSDGVFRRVPALQQYKGDVYASLGVELARAALGWEKLEFVWASGAEVRDNNHLERLQIGNLEIPVDGDLALYVPYRGPSFTIPYVSAVDVLRGTADAKLLRDKVVLVGTSAPGLLDARVTPVSENFVGVEVHANIVDGILNQRIKYHPPYMMGAHILLLVLLAVLTTFILARFPVVPAMLGTLLLAALLVAGNLLLWQNADFIVPLASPLLFMALVFVLQTVYGLLIESRGKRYLSQMFGQYVPPELVEEMDRDRQEISLEGESRDMSVLFSDVRGFTSVS
ncbi:MAG TPA: CHASE2 domain-containing protein, partial [Gammaproteobacteria bacterium]